MAINNDATLIAASHNFGMFSANGNRRIHTLAIRLLDRLAAIHAHAFGKNYYVEGRGPRTAEMEAYKSFFVAWRKMSRSKSYREATDTAVREAVWVFALKCAGYSEMCEEFDVDSAWDAADCAAAGMDSETFSRVRIPKLK